MLILIGAVSIAPVTAAQSDQTPAEIRQKALAEAGANRWETAEPVLAALAAGEPVDVQACVQLSRRRLEQDKAKEAVDLLERATKAAPNQADLHVQLGNALAQRISEVNIMQKGMLAGKMRAAYEKAVELDPSNVAGWAGLSQYFANAPAIVGGSLEKAEGFAKEVEKRDAYQGALLRGSVEAKKGQVDAAAQQFRRAGELKPQEPRAFAALGYAYARAGRKDEARAAFQTALQRQPEYLLALKGLKELEELSPKN